MSFYDLPAWKTSTFGGFKHKYLSIKPSDPSKSVILMLHGFPDGLPLLLSDHVEIVNLFPQ